MSDNSQRTEKATPRRIQKAREKGDFPAAREFVSAIQFLAFVLIAAAAFPHWLEQFQNAFRSGLRQSFTDSLTPGDLIALINRLSRAALLPLASLGGTLLALTLLVQMAATSGGFSFTRLAPSFDRLNPARRLKEVPWNNTVSFLQALVLLPAMIWITWSIVRDRLMDLLRLPLLPIAAGAAQGGLLLKQVLTRAAFILLAFGVIMLVRERARYSRRLRMSKQEIREESKENEGNPQTKARVRRIQRDMRRRNMMREVATATAVIVNPTHYAVALKYEPGTNAAPLVIAKGKNYLAARIRQRAISNQVPIIENPPLAQALYKTVEVGQEIPAHLYRAVAGILAWVFRVMNNNGIGGNAKR